MPKPSHPHPSPYSSIHPLLSTRESLRTLFTHISLSLPHYPSRQILARLEGILASDDIIGPATGASTRTDGSGGLRGMGLDDDPDPEIKRLFNHLHSHLPSPLSRSKFTPHQLLRATNFYAVEGSTAEEWVERNRYGNIWAFDRTGVRVPANVDVEVHLKGGGEEDWVYLNANVIADHKGSWWVASQAPTPTTFHTFFLSLYLHSATQTYHHLHPHPSSSRTGAEGSGPGSSSGMVEELERGAKAKGAKGEKTVILVQLTNWFDGRVAKADNYLPRSTSKPLYLPPTPSHPTQPPLTLSLLSQTSLPELQSTLSTLSLSLSAPSTSLSPLSSTSNPATATRPASSSALTIKHYLFHLWPDHGVPTEEGEVEALRGLVERVRGEREGIERGDEGEVEVWVHCSAGVGRTGTFIALSSLLSPTNPTTSTHPSSPLGPFPAWAETDEVAQIIDLLREQRGMMVQSESQVELIYRMTGRRPGREG